MYAELITYCNTKMEPLTRFLPFKQWLFEAMLKTKAGLKVLTNFIGESSNKRQLNLPGHLVFPLLSRITV